MFLYMYSTSHIWPQIWPTLRESNYLPPDKWQNQLGDVIVTSHGNIPGHGLNFSIGHVHLYMPVVDGNRWLSCGNTEVCILRVLHGAVFNLGQSKESTTFTFAGYLEDITGEWQTHKAHNTTNRWPNAAIPQHPKVQGVSPWLAWTAVPGGGVRQSQIWSRQTSNEVKQC